MTLTLANSLLSNEDIASVRLSTTSTVSSKSFSFRSGWAVKVFNDSETLTAALVSPIGTWSSKGKRKPYAKLLEKGKEKSSKKGSWKKWQNHHFFGKK